MQRVMTLAVISLSLLIGACHDAYEEPYSETSYYEADYTPYIRYFSVLPAPGARAWDYGAAPITPHLDNGNFALQWEIGSYGQYHVDLYVSNDPWLGLQDPWGREDVLFKHLGGMGNSYNTAYNTDTVFMSCRFTTDNILSCGQINYDNPGRDLTPYLNVLPKTGYIILRACDEYMQDCAITSRYVEFQ